MTTKEKIEVMQAYDNDQEIQYQPKGDIYWRHSSTPMWNWNATNYRIKPEVPCVPLIDRIRGEYAEYVVVELDWFCNLLQFSDGHPHIHGQSMSGFYRYVYDDGDGFTVMVDPVWCVHGVNFHPVAVLFTKDKS